MIRKLLIALFLLAVSNVSHADETLRLESHRGSIVLVDFWASWCVPCRHSFPWMNTMQERYGDKGLKIIAVNLDRDSASAESFLQSYPASFEIAFDPDGNIARQYQLEVMPSSIIFDRDGEIVYRHTGFRVKRQDNYEKVIRAALGLETQE